MGVDHGGTGDKSPQNLERGIVPQILSCCKILSTRLLAMHYNERKCVFLLQQDFYSKSHHAPPRVLVSSTPMTVGPAHIIRQIINIC